MIQQVERALDALVQFPLMDRIGRVAGTRELYLAKTPFLVAYRVKGPQVEIVGFMHAARRWPDSFDPA